MPCQQETGRWEGYKELERDRTRTAAQAGQRGVLYHMPACGIVNWGELARGAHHSSRTGWHQSESGEQLHWASFVFTYLFIWGFFCLLIIIIVFPSFSILLNCLYLNPPVLQFSPQPHSEGAEQTAVRCWVAYYAKQHETVLKGEKSSFMLLSEVCYEIGWFFFWLVNS